MSNEVEYKFPAAPQDCATILPNEARSIFSRGEYYGTSAGFCLGYLQANLVVLPQEHADNFEEFCNKNSAAFPLLFRSRPGEVEAPPLAKDFNVRSDVPRYLIFSHGRQVDDMRDLLGFDWTNMVSFYLGCSFSMEQALLDSGIDLPYASLNRNVSMYLSNIPCQDVNDQFTGACMVVSMRPIKQECIQKAVSVSACYPHCHGAPIHIGDPRKIGLSDIERVDYGDKPIYSAEGGEVPVFWACGVTGTQAVSTLKAKLSFTHYPGSMVITDNRVAPVIISEGDSPHVIPISPERLPYHASLVSERVLEQLQHLEDVLTFDPNGCKIKELMLEGDFVRSVLTLSHSDCVGVVFGFPCNIGYECSEETDGPPGSLAIAKALNYMGKKVTIISEERNRSIIESCVGLMLSQNDLVSTVEFKSCDEIIATNGKDFDCLIAIERMGPASDGGHYTMKGIDLTNQLELIDAVFTQNKSIVTIGIGDRGNELGLGRIYDKAKVILGDKTCTLASDYVVMTGVSNWGGHAIAAGLYLLVTCPVHSRYLNHGVTRDNTPVWTLEGFLQKEENVVAVLKQLNMLGLRDGISKSAEQSVDSVPLKTHLEMIEKMRLIAQAKS